MTEKRIINKMFLPAGNLTCDAIFCIYETAKSFWGYKIEKTSANHAAKVYIGKKCSGNRRYLNCDQLVEFPKSVHYEPLYSRYNLKKLRIAIMEFAKETQPQKIISVGHCAIPNYDSCSREQLENRRNPVYHKQLKDAINRRQLAIINNERDVEKKMDELIAEIKQKLGYVDRAPTRRREPPTPYTVTNPRPYRGGGFSSK